MTLSAYLIIAMGWDLFSYLFILPFVTSRLWDSPHRWHSYKLLPMALSVGGIAVLTSGNLLEQIFKDLALPQWAPIVVFGGVLLLQAFFRYRVSYALLDQENPSELGIPVMATLASCLLENEAENDPAPCESPACPHRRPRITRPP